MIVSPPCHRRGLLALLPFALLAACAPGPAEEAPSPSATVAPAPTPLAPPYVVSQWAEDFGLDVAGSRRAPHRIAPHLLEDLHTQSFAWQSCPDGECAEIEVPLSYAELDGETITLHASRRPADEQSRGALVLDLRDPRLHRMSFPDFAEEVLSTELLASYDVVTVERRGPGLRCLAELDLDGLWEAASPGGDYAAEIESLTDSCAEDRESMELDSFTAARDIDVLLAVMGEWQLSFLTRAEGSYLALAFAELYPQAVGRLVFDGSIHPALSGTAVPLGQAQRYGEVFGDEAVARTTALGPGLEFIDLPEADLMLHWALSCLDRPLSEPEHLLGLPERLHELSPHFGTWFTAREIVCAALTDGAVEPVPRDPEAGGTGPLLGVVTTGDPQTLPEWTAPMMLRVLAGTSLTFDAEGHGGYGRDECVDSAVEGYLLEGVLPPFGATC